MGILKITPRRESLQSGQSVGAGQINIPNHHIARLSVGPDESVKYHGMSDLGRGVADLGGKMLDLAVKLQEERNEMELNEFESDFLNSLRGVTMDPEKGLFTRNLTNSQDIDALANDGPKAVKDVFDEVAERHGFTGNKRTWAEHRVRGAVLSTQGRIVERVAGAHRQLKITTATNLTQAQLGHWRDNPDDRNATLDLIDSYRAQQYASGYDDQAVDLKVGQFVGDIAAEYATQSFKALPDEKAVDDMLGKLEKDPSAILAGNQVLAGQFSTKTPFDPKTTDQLKDALEARRREIQARDMRTVSEAANVGIAAVAQIRDKDGNYQPGRLAAVEQSIESLQRIGATLPQGSRAATEAAAEASRINGEADREVARMIENSLLSGENLMMDDGKTLVYDQNIEKRFIRLYPAAKAKVDEMRRKDRSRVMSDNARDLHMSEVMLDYAILDGTLSEDQIARRKRDIYDRARAMTEGLLLSPEDGTTFRKRWTARNAADESAAAVDFDRAFGLSLRDFADAKGDISTEITDAGYKKAVKSGQKAIFPGTDEKVSLGEYLKMRASFLERLRALPANADRRQETAKLLEEFKGGWYARQAEANIDALSRTMNDIHLGIEAEVEAERLKAAAEEEKRNMPLVDMRHPANAEPATDPLEFYRQANPLDPTLNLR